MTCIREEEDWLSTQVANSHLVCDPTIRQPGFDVPRSATVVSAEPFSHGTGTLRCLQKEMATYRHLSVSFWRDTDDVPDCWILSPDKTEWWLISATLCGWRRCFVADQLWFMTRVREEEEDWLLVRRWSSTKLDAWYTSNWKVRHLHTWPTTYSLLLTAIIITYDQRPTGPASFHFTTSVIEVWQLQVHACGTVCHLTYGRTRVYFRPLKKGVVLPLAIVKNG